MNTIHGHEIMEFLASHPEGISLEALSAHADKTYGSDAVFFTCCAENLSLAQLLQFLAERGKVFTENQLFFLGDHPPCDHH